MASRSRRPSRSSRSHAGTVVRIRIGSPSAASKYEEVHVRSLEDARAFAQTIDRHVRAHPGQMLILAVDGHQPWLRDLLAGAITGSLDQVTDTNREVQFSSTSRLPEKAVRGSWSFVTDQINVPEVFYWSVDTPAPRPNDLQPLDLNKAKIRTGAWLGGPGSCRWSSEITTAIIFTKSDKVSSAIVGDLLFPALYKDGEVSPHQEDSAVCLIFSRLFWLLTDWQNIIRELSARLAEAEINSHHRDYPVKYRTRAMHREVARIHELKDYLRFHSRSLSKLQKLPLQSRRQHDEIDDTVDDLAHFEENLDSLKERFSNLLGLEFNIQAADQSEGAAFLSIVATLFLPLSYLTSLWGISTSAWETTWYAVSAAIVFTVSALFLVIYPWLSKKLQKRLYYNDQSKILLQPQDFTMLGNDLPDNVDLPNRPAFGTARHRSQQLGGVQLTPQRHRSEPMQGFKDV